MKSQYDKNRQSGGYGMVPIVPFTHSPSLSTSTLSPLTAPPTIFCHPLPPVHNLHIYTAQKNNIMAAATTRRKLSVSICIPLHNTSLPLTNNYDAIVSKRSLLVIQCHSEGVFWRGLVPLLMMGNPEHRSTAMTQAALKVLVHQFSSHIITKVETNKVNAEEGNKSHDICNWISSAKTTIISNNNIISGQHHDDL